MRIRSLQGRKATLEFQIDEWRRQHPELLSFIDDLHRGIVFDEESDIGVQEAETRATKKTPKRYYRAKSAYDKKRESIIFGAIEAKLKGAKYCAELDAKKLLASERWRSENWPGSYSQAYKQNPEWRKRIHDQNHRFQVKYDNLTLAARRAIIESTKSTRATRR